MNEESKFFDFDLEEDELDILMEDVNELLQDLETGILQLEEKANLTYRFFKSKLREYEVIKKQIHELSQEIEKNESDFIEVDEVTSTTMYPSFRLS